MSKVRISKKIGKDTRMVSYYSPSNWIIMNILALPFKALWWIIKLPFVVIGSIFSKK